ncbi:hypothetical protein BDU57DRAFT_517675 [Ampelomyces quisqualis]|uniref:Uncharacterized protein n=1 Tax=Ampelomyces quisqualis TaxID=50730 RepID=A0A6A5QP52_AMPQU|nr:hypothetical protein BDU57DRAFT_517675 [Ampelomyces quisqualis]
MTSAAYDSSSHYHQRPRHDSYHARHDHSMATSGREKLTAMRHSESPGRYSAADYSHAPRAPRAPPRPTRPTAPPHSPSLPSSSSSSHQHPYPSPPRARTPTWPPSPSVEDETAALAKEVLSSRVAAERVADAEGEPPVHSRGALDQETLLEDVGHADDRRFVLVSEPRDDRRKNFAARGNMAPLKTDIADPPMLTERASTPYAYTRPQRESTAPSFPNVLSPEPLTPVSARGPSSVSRRNTRDQNANPQRPGSRHGPYDSPLKPPRASKNDVFDDSDFESDGATQLRTAERKPARYSFVRSDLQKEDLRMNLDDYQPNPEPRRRDSGTRPPPALRREESSSSFKDNSYTQSPRSSSSSLNSGSRRSRPAPVDTSYYSSSRAPSRPSSPLQQAPSPKLPPRRRESPPTPRSTPRGNTRPASPLSFLTTLQPPSPGRAPITDADWYATYPPVAARDRSRPPSRMSRYDTMPESTPRIDVQSPSPARPPPTGAAALPYPVDDRPLGIFMPSEEHYQFDHSSIASPRQSYPDSTNVSASPTPGSPRLRDEAYRPRDTVTSPEDSLRDKSTRCNSFRSQVGPESRRGQAVRVAMECDVDKPLRSCPRSATSAKFDDWYSLKGHRSFDICPSCYDGVFADTPFAIDFSQTHRGKRPIERFCDFSSPWTRLAWLLTIKQRLPSLELLHALADIADVDRPCPDDRELSSDRVTWYGIPDQRDGLHVANFAICSSDKKMIEALLPTMRGCFTKLPSTYSSSIPEKHICSLRTSSRRFPKYLDLLIELDTEAQDLGQRPRISRFIQMARDNAFKGECARDKAYFRKPWLFIPSLPEFAVCEECYDDLVWPASQSKSTPNTIPRSFNKTLQLVPNEDPEVGSSCCLYSPRMRRVFDTSVKEADFGYLKRKAVDRKRAEIRLTRERRDIMKWMGTLDRSSSQWERAKKELKVLEREWALYE